MRIVKQYILNILIAIDQLFNALFFGCPDETISSRVGKMVHFYGTKKKPIIWLAWILDKVDPDHTKKTIEWDEGKGNIHIK